MPIIIPGKTVAQNTVSLFIDESICHEDSGIIHATFAFPTDAVPMIEESLSEYLVREGLQTDEYKGSKINSVNKDAYRKFIFAIIEVAHKCATLTPLRPMLTIEGKNCHFSNEAVNTAFRSIMSIPNMSWSEHERSLIRAFCQQIWWIFRFITKTCERPITNSFDLVFDEKHNFEEMIDENKLVLLPFGVHLHERTRGKCLVSFANSIIGKYSEILPRPDTWIPRISLFTYRNSASSRILQGCDLFSHIYFNAIKHAKGDRSERVVIKNNLFNNFFGTPISDDLLSSFEVAQRTPTQKELRCTNLDLTEVARIGEFKLLDD